MPLDLAEGFNNPSASASPPLPFSKNIRLRISWLKNIQQGKERFE
jgi:hypothetical protein